MLSANSDSGRETDVEPISAIDALIPFKKRGPYILARMDSLTLDQN
jgi:hypothetical protein